MTKIGMNHWNHTVIALTCGSIILLISLGIRHTFGLFLQPITLDQGWGRETFAFAIAIQNLVWGFSQPIAGMIADRIGAKSMVMLGALFYGIGLGSMSYITNELLFIFSSGVLIGIGLSGTTFPVIFGAISRLLPPEKRSLAMGVTMSVGSFGQFALLPISLWLLNWFDWQITLIIFSVLALTMLFLALGIRESDNPISKGNSERTMTQTLRIAFGNRDFWFLSIGFFACGFQVVFIALHLPVFLTDSGLRSSVGTTVLALIGLLNIVGTYYAGLWGGSRRKPLLLSWIYLGRALVIIAFILFPITNISAFLFGAFMGLFWLATIPLTNGTIATIWGVKHLSMLSGIVFLCHQLGSFFGGWIGGWLYDNMGNYDLAWGIAIGISLFSAVINFPIREQSLSARKIMT